MSVAASRVESADESKSASPRTRRPAPEQQPQQAETSERGRRKIRVGYVISDKMAKTVVVEALDLKSHRLYKKTIQRRARYKAHDETDQCGVGDLVRIMETRPISKDKRWRVVEVVEKAR